DGIRERNVTGVQTCALPICDRALVQQVPAERKKSRKRTGLFISVLLSGRHRQMYIPHGEMLRPDTAHGNHWRNRRRRNICHNKKIGRATCRERKKKSEEDQE